MVLVLALFGCPYVGPQTFDEEVRDADGDGAVADRFGGPDCNDADPSIVDCDADGDGEDAVALGGTDCDDANATVYPQAPELCDGLDNDCDGLIDDDDAVDEANQRHWYADADGDDFGTGTAARSCDAPPGFVSNALDCDDSRADTNPNAPEFCDAIDHNCDGDDTLNATEPPSWFVDLDADGARGTVPVALQCEAPADTVPESAPVDCNDADPHIHPAAEEIWYDGVDQDCAGDDDFDQDADGSVLDDDCNDLRPEVAPGAPEICDGLDNNCDHLIDDDDPARDASTGSTFYGDSDGDGFGGDLLVELACTAPAGFALVADDCDDTRADTHPGADERCDGLDHDCDGDLTNGSVDANTYFHDVDGDTFGSDTDVLLSCGPPATDGVWLLVGGDCNDLDPAMNPDALEICGDDVRQDCSATPVDDCDADGFADADDCGPDDPTIAPGMPEVCDGLDNDCDGAFDGDDPDVDLSTATLWYPDADTDGYGAGSALAACSQPAGHVQRGDDCDDAADTVFPGAPELCDGADNDCDGAADDADPQGTELLTWYRDVDQDEHGDPSNAMQSCARPSTGTWTLTSDDCNDLLATTSPSAPEVCDGADNDCDGAVDVNAIDATTFYGDNDGDGFGSAALPVLACNTQGAVAASSDDCNDADPDTYPGAPEICGDSLRQDCSTFHPADCDADGTLAIAAGGTDCDDENIAVLVGAPETCDGIDNDCDGLFDDADPDVDLTTTTLWYADVDGDGFGDPDSELASCGQPAGYVLDATDCDDLVDTTFPGAAETCDGIDNDCNGTADDGSLVGAPLWFTDADDDGFGDDQDSGQPACAQPPGKVAVQGDCDDTLFAVHPDADEVCDSVDNDCSGAINDNPVNGSTYYADTDDDGFGAQSVTRQACAQPPGYVSIAMDCNDANGTVFPGAVEVCYDGIRQDCLPVGLDDCDGDGFDGLTAGGTDCDDLDTTVVPGAPEICDGVDNDCDGLLDDLDPDIDLSTTTDWLPDGDGDGFGAGAPVSACSRPVGHELASAGLDCNDGSSLHYPGADEVCGGGDNDCDGLADDADLQGPTNPSTWYRDVDGDSFGDLAVPQVACADPSDLNAFVLNPDDCNDAAATAFPAAPEICDGLDNDCDSLTDDDDAQITGQTTYFADVDGDGYHLATSARTSCQQPPGFILPNPGGADCNDNNVIVNPGATEVCNAGLDDDCDGLVDTDDPDLAGTNTRWYPDNDGDGYGVTADETVQCSQPGGFVALSGDCNDARPDLAPNQQEVCDFQNLDEDCDGFVNDNDPDVANTTTWYEDGDGDGYGDDSAGTLEACLEPPTHPASAAGDCNDDDPALNPAARWLLDADGDGSVDPASTIVVSCSPPTGLHISALSPVDCDDSNGARSPLLHEIYYDGIDNDCDPDTVDSDKDGDGDGIGIDCDDDNALVNTQVAEIYGNRTPGGALIDDNCSGAADDEDGDGFVGQTALPGETGYDPTLDCDDRNALRFPAATEADWYNNLDDDCNPLTRDWDQDNDNFFVDVPAWFTPQPTSQALTGLQPGDCDDTNAAAVPWTSATPLAVGPSDNLQATIDNVCDGAVLQITGLHEDVSISTRGRSITLKGTGTLQGMGGDADPLTTGSTLTIATTTLHAPFDVDPDGALAVLESVVRIEGLTFTEGDDPTGGAIDLSPYQTLGLDDVTLRDNFGTNGGAVLARSGSTLVVANSLFEDNTAIGLGGGLSAGFFDAQDLSLLSLPADVMVTTSVFRNNIAAGGGGGMSMETADVRVHDTVFEDNSGPGIAVELFSGSASFDRIQVESSSGPLFFLRGENGGSTVLVSDSVFAGPAENFHLRGGSLLLRNSVVGSGLDVDYSAGGILLEESSLVVERSAILDNVGQRAGNIQYNSNSISSFDRTYFGFGLRVDQNSCCDPIDGHDIEAQSNDLDVNITGSIFFDYDPAVDVVGILDPVDGVDNVTATAAFMRFDVGMSALYWDLAPSTAGSSLWAAGPHGDSSVANVDYFTDSDADGLPDGWELRAAQQVFVDEPLLTSDLTLLSGSGDFDGDGLSDVQERMAGTHPMVSDTDRDGYTDKEELDGSHCGTFTSSPTSNDTDADGLPDDDECETWATDPSVPDTDADGLLDGDEVNVYRTLPTNTDTDEDGLDDAFEANDPQLDPLDDDVDDDRMLDGPDWVNCDATNPDADGDGLSDYVEWLAVPDGMPFSCRQEDFDFDGVSDFDEMTIYGSNPIHPDSDGDSLLDGEEAGVSNLLQWDSDRDGLSDGQEAYSTYDICASDTDSNTIPDGPQSRSCTVGALSADADNDGLPDCWEDVIDLWISHYPSAYRPGPNKTVPEVDDDPLDSGEEFALGTNPRHEDTDGDGVLDHLDPFPLTYYLPALATELGYTVGVPLPANCP